MEASDAFSVLIGGVLRSFKHIVLNSNSLARNPIHGSMGIRYLFDDKASLKICSKYMIVHGVVFLQQTKFAHSLFTRSFMSSTDGSQPPLVLVEILVEKRNNHPLSLVVYNQNTEKMRLIKAANFKTFMEQYTCAPDQVISEELGTTITSLSDDFFLNGIPDEHLESIVFSPNKLVKSGVLKTSVCNLVIICNV